MTDIKLKCCPFCGSDGVMITTDDEYFWVRCASCDSEQGSGGSEVEAAKAWNSRSEQADQQEIACLKKQISQLEADKLSTAAYAEQRINLLKMINKNTQSVKADAKKKGARTFRDEMLAASKCILHPHIEGVFAVYESKFDKMIEAENEREGKS